MKKIKLNSLIKWSLITFSFAMTSCSVNRDLRHKTKTNTLKLNPSSTAFNYHFKNGNYIISVNDRIGNKLKARFINLQDSSAFKNDTIDLELTDVYWTKSLVQRVLRSRIEMNDANIYSISESKYINKIKRTVSKSKANGIHSRYLYTNIINGDTILYSYSYSFDIGTPPF